MEPTTRREGLVMLRVSRRFESVLTEMAAMRALTAEVCRQAWACTDDDEQLGKLQLALTEAAANIIRHAYDGEAGRPIVLELQASPDQVRLTLFHEGRDFDPKAAPAPAFDGSREGGFGLYMIARLVDEVFYFRDAGGQRGVRLVQRRSSNPAGEIPMQLAVDKVGDVAVVAVNVEQFDAGNADEFKRQMAQILPQNRKVVLDLAKVQFVDSRGCGAILSCLKSLTEVGGDLKLCRIGKFVRSVFELIRLHRICEIFDTPEQAVKAFGG
jgi:anti-sigma B factor antagonist